jgi:hypothetical protein
MYNLLDKKNINFKNLGMITGFNYKPYNKESIKLDNIYLSEDKNVIEEKTFIEFYNFINIKNAAFSRKNNKKGKKLNNRFNKRTKRR